MQISKKWMAIGGVVALVLVIGLAVGLNQGGLFKGALVTPISGTLTQQQGLSTSNLSLVATYDTPVFQVTDAAGTAYDLMTTAQAAPAFGTDASGKLTLNTKALNEMGLMDVKFKFVEKQPLQIVQPNLELALPQVLPELTQPPINQELIAIPTGPSPIEQLAAPSISSQLLAPSTSSELVAPSSSTILAAPTTSLNTTLSTGSTNLAAPSTSSELLTPSTSTELLIPSNLKLSAPTTTTTTTTTTIAPSSQILAPLSSSSTEILSSPPSRLSSALPVANAATLLQQSALTPQTTLLQQAPLGNLLPQTINLSADQNGVYTIPISNLSNGSVTLNISDLGLTIPVELIVPCDQFTKFSFTPASVSYDGTNNLMTVGLLAWNGPQTVDIKNLCDSSMTTLGLDSGVGITLVDSVDGTQTAKESFDPKNMPATLFGGFITVTQGTKGPAMTFDFTKNTAVGNIGTLKTKVTYNLTLVGVADQKVSDVLPVLDDTRSLVIIKPPVSSNLKVALAPVPASKTVVKGTTATDLLGLTLTSSATDNVLKGISIQAWVDGKPDGTASFDTPTQDNVAARAVVDTLSLYDGTTQVGTTEPIDTLTGKVIFSNFTYTVPANTTKTLTLKGNFSNLTTAGTRIKFGIAAANDVVITDTNNNPITGVDVSAASNGAKTDSGVILTVSSGLLTIPPKTLILDTDNDTVADLTDNCPNVSNLDQKDMDQDEIGDACDPVDDLKAAADAAALKAAADQKAAADAAALKAAADAAATKATADAAAAKAAADKAIADAAAAKAAADKAIADYNYTHDYYTSLTDKPVVTVPVVTSPCLVAGKTFTQVAKDSQFCKDLQALVNVETNKAIFTVDQPAVTPSVRYTSALAIERILKEAGATLRVKNLPADWTKNFVDGNTILQASTQEQKDYQTVYASGILQGKLDAQTGLRRLDAGVMVSYIELFAMFQQAVSNGLGESTQIIEANLPAFILDEYRRNPDYKWIAQAYSYAVEKGLITKNEFTRATLFNYATRADMASFLAKFKAKMEAEL